MGIGRPGVVLPRWLERSLWVEVAWVDGSRGGEQEPSDPVQPSGLEDRNVQQGVVARDQGPLRGVPPAPAQLRRQVVDLAHALRDPEAKICVAEVHEIEFVGRRRLEYRGIEIRASHPTAPRDEVLHHVMADKAARPGDEHSLRHLARLRNDLESVYASRQTVQSIGAGATVAGVGEGGGEVLTFRYLDQPSPRHPSACAHLPSVHTQPKGSLLPRVEVLRR